MGRSTAGADHKLAERPELERSSAGAAILIFERPEVELFNGRGMENMRLVTPLELAKALQVPVGTIYRWNHRGTGPRPLHVGRHVRYREEDVEAWLKSAEVRGER